MIKLSELQTFKGNVCRLYCFYKELELQNVDRDYADQLILL